MLRQKATWIIECCKSPFSIINVISNSCAWKKSWWPTILNSQTNFFSKVNHGCSFLKLSVFFSPYGIDLDVLQSHRIQKISRNCKWYGSNISSPWLFAWRQELLLTFKSIFRWIWPFKSLQEQLICYQKGSSSFQQRRRQKRFQSRAGSRVLWLLIL